MKKTVTRQNSRGNAALATGRTPAEIRADKALQKLLLDIRKNARALRRLRKNAAVLQRTAVRSGKAGDDKEAQRIYSAASRTSARIKTLRMQARVAREKLVQVKADESLKKAVMNYDSRLQAKRAAAEAKKAKEELRRKKASTPKNNARGKRSGKKAAD